MPTVLGQSFGHQIVLLEKREPPEAAKSMVSKPKKVVRVIEKDK